jgi:hypothetical protein
METKTQTMAKSAILTSTLFFMVLLMLVYLRFRAFDLETTLSGINRGIENYSLEEIELRKQLSGITSMPNIFSYCKEKLGMESPKRVERIYVQETRVAAIPSTSQKEGWLSKMLLAFGFSRN